MKSSTKQILDGIQAYSKIKQLYLDQYTMISHLRDDLRAHKFELDEMVNIIFILRNISKFADDLRKECDGIGHMFENVLCALYITQNKTEPIRTALATGTPTVNLGVKMPNKKKDPEAFDKFIKFFNVSAEAVDSKIVKPYWPGICEKISQMSEEGKPLPPGISVDDTYPTYKVRLIAYQELDLILEKFEQLRLSLLKEADGKEEEASAQLISQRPTKNKE